MGAYLENYKEFLLKMGNWIKEEKQLVKELAIQAEKCIEKLFGD